MLYSNSNTHASPIHMLVEVLDTSIGINYVLQLEKHCYPFLSSQHNPATLPSLSYLFMCYRSVALALISPRHQNREYKLSEYRLIGDKKHILTPLATQPSNTTCPTLVVDVFVEVLLEFGHVLWGVDTLVALEGLVQELLPGNGCHGHHHPPLLQAADHI